ncbi:hypothetical protein MYX75_07845 [Acidobacteria bacterium AH-259-A15]|nr:hypothetical protein [Acidobacteria bacterium AH-259-A15]
MSRKRPQPPRPDRIRSIRGSFSWIDHRFLRQGFDQGLTRLEKLFYFVLIAVSNRDGVSFYSEPRLCELLDVRYPHELVGARNQLMARDLIAFESGIYQVLQLPLKPLPAGQYKSSSQDQDEAQPGHYESAGKRRPRQHSPRGQAPPSEWKSLGELLGIGKGEGSDD